MVERNPDTAADLRCEPAMQAEQSLSVGIPQAMNEHPLDRQLWMCRQSRREAQLASELGLADPAIVTIALALARLAAHRDVLDGAKAGAIGA